MVIFSEKAQSNLKTYMIPSPKKYGIDLTKHFSVCKVQLTITYILIVYGMRTVYVDSLS